MSGLKQKSLIGLFLAVLVGIGLYIPMSTCFSDKKVEKQKKGEVLRSARRVEKAIPTKKEVKISPAKHVAKGVSKGGFFEDELFNGEVDFSFDEEKEAKLSEELKSVIRDLNKAMAGFQPDRKLAYQSLQRLLAIIGRDGANVPAFVKLEALKAISMLGCDAMAEAVAFLGDSEPQVVKAAQKTLMEQLMDFDATEADQVAVIRQLVKLDSLSPEECESIMFAVSSFHKTSNKVAVGLEIYDHGTENAFAALSKNVDFIYEEAQAESIQSRSDIVKYGKDHPDGKDDDLVIKFQ